LAVGPGTLKKLSSKHHTIIACAIQGMKIREIARKVGMRDTSISRILNSQVAREAIQKHLAEMDDRLLMLKAKVIEAFEDALAEGVPIETRLAAADKWLKAHGHYERGREKQASISLEDVVAKLVTNVQVNVQVNNNEEGIDG
jgi:hypothetical protein